MALLAHHPAPSIRLRNGGVTEGPVTPGEGEAFDGKRACSEDVLG